MRRFLNAYRLLKLLITTNVRFQVARIIAKHMLEFDKIGLRGKRRLRILIVRFPLIATLYIMLFPAGLMWPRLFEYLFFLKHVKVVETKVMLDIGTGLSPIPALASLFFPKARIIAMDLERGWMLEQKLGCSALGIQNVEMIIADCQHLPFRGESIDLVSCISTIEHIENDFITIKEIEGVLTKGGLLILTTDYATDESKCFPYGRVYDESSLQSLIGCFELCYKGYLTTLARKIPPVIRSSIIINFITMIMVKLLKGRKADIALIALRKR